jgi:tetratricopeptide (TPR) repeat protein
MSGTGLWSELKRRKVVRVAVAYAVTAFIVLQVADLVLEPLGLPPWAMTLVILLLVLGFLPALVVAWWFEWTPAGVRRTTAAAQGPADASQDPPSAAPVALRGWPLPHRILVTGAALVLALAGGAFLVLGDRTAPDAATLDPAAVAVLPFRISADPALSYLGQGMVDLLAAKLTGEGGLRAVDSRSVLRLWEQATGAGMSPVDRAGALALARNLGAGQLLLGEVVGAPGQISLSATLHDVKAGSAGTPATVVGPVDSLPWLVDRLVAQLLSMRAGQDGRRLAVLTSASLPALRAYLDGKAAYRGGQFADAATHFRRAVEIDSTFALAGFDLILAGMWAEGGAQIDLGRRIAWQGRDRLPARERRRLEINREPSFPAALSAWEALVRDEHQDAEAWFELGEMLLHTGPAAGHPDVFDRALHAFERAVAIDSIYAPALYHAIEIHTRRGDSAQVRRLADIYFHRNAPESGYHSYIGWRTALALNDRELLSAMRTGGFGAAPYYDLPPIVFLGQADALPLADVELALAALERRAGTTAERTAAAHSRVTYLLNAGRPAEAERVRRAGRRLADEDDHGLALVVRAGLFWGGDTAVAASAAARLEARVATPPPTEADETLQRIEALCALEEWRLLRGDASRTAASLAAVRAATEAAPPGAIENEVLRRGVHLLASRCVAHLSALGAAVRSGDPLVTSVAVELATLDSLLATFRGRGPTIAVGNLIAARLHESRGEAEAALRAIRRRPYWGPPYLLSTFLLEEARLAEQAGDTAGAVNAYSHYLHLRAASEPAVAADVERARRELERLSAGRR